jgi:NADH-quinone oxidoreductase subunit E
LTEQTLTVKTKPGTHPLITTNEVVQLSDSEKQQIDKALHHVPFASGASIDALKIVQQHRGWVSDSALKALSEHMGISTADLDGVATFYNLIFRQPVGKVVLHPCDGISCDLMGGKKVRGEISKKLAIGDAQTTDDNQFTLIPLPCLGACDKAPVMIAAEQLFENLSVDQLDNVLEHLTQHSSKQGETHE